MNTANFARTGMYLAFSLRRDWLRLVLWMLFLVGLMTAVAAEFEGIYGTTSEIKAITDTLKTSAMVSILGAFPLEGQVTTAQVFACEMVLFMALIQIIMNISLALRATRGEEDNGVTEMIRAHAVGKLMPLTAAAGELVIVNVLTGILYALGLSAAGMPGADASGSWLIGMALAACGLMFGMLALLAAQLSDHAGGAAALAYLLLGAAYLVRMIADVDNPDNTWWSPLGWVEKTVPYIDNNWLPLLYMALAAVILFGLAALANLRRDLGAGAIASRPGRRGASPLLAGSATLLFRLERRTVIAWILSLLCLGAMYGSVFNTVGDIIKTNPTIQQVLGKAAVNGANHKLLLNFLSLLNIIFAVLATVPALQIMNKLKGDETKGWLEAVYARPVSRVKQFLSYGLTAMASGALIFLAGLGGAVLTGNSVIKAGAERITASEFWQTYWGMLPAVLVMVAFAAVLVGWLPRLVGVSWLYLAYGFVALYMGNLLHMPAWAKRIAPFGWGPNVPVHDVNWTTFSWMIALSVVLGAIGLAGYIRRDLKMG